MRLAIAMLVLVSAFAASATPVRAQEQTQIPASSVEQRSAELAKWLKEYRAWEKWFEQWGNRVERDFNDDHSGDARSVPSLLPGSRRHAGMISSSMSSWRVPATFSSPGTISRCKSSGAEIRR